MLPRLLFLLTCGLALAMGILLVISPWLESSSRLMRLIARDAAVRRTLTAAALGLVVTACVFFRRSAPPDDTKSTKAPRGPVGA